MFHCHLDYFQNPLLGGRPYHIDKTHTLLSIQKVKSSLWISKWHHNMPVQIEHFYLLARPHTSPDLVQNLFSDRLHAPLLYSIIARVDT